MRSTGHVVAIARHVKGADFRADSLPDFIIKYRRQSALENTNDWHHNRTLLIMMTLTMLSIVVLAPNTAALDDDF